MSAEVLRAAADGMRGEYETDPFRLGQTMLAVADWLEQHARSHDTALVHMGRASSCSWLEDSDDAYVGTCEAFTVARTYLGDSV